MDCRTLYTRARSPASVAWAECAVERLGAPPTVGSGRSGWHMTDQLTEHAKFIIALLWLPAGHSLYTQTNLYILWDWINLHSFVTFGRSTLKLCNQFHFIKLWSVYIKMSRGDQPSTLDTSIMIHRPLSKHPLGNSGWRPLFMGQRINMATPTLDMYVYASNYGRRYRSTEEKYAG